MLFAKRIRINVLRQDGDTLEFTQSTCRTFDNWHLSPLKAGAKRSLYDAKKTLPQSRRVGHEINAVYGKLLQEVSFRLDEARQAFFRLAKAEETPGFSLCRPRYPFFTLKYPGMDIRVEGKTLTLPTGGKGKSKTFSDVQDQLTEDPPAQFREVSITKDAVGHYYATCLQDVLDPLLEADDGSAIPYDLGIKTLATGYSTAGRFVHIGRFTTYRWDNKQLDHVRSLRSRCKKGSRRYRYLTQVYHRVSRPETS